LVPKELFHLRNVFATNLQELGKTNLYKHTIDTGDSKPIKCRPYRTSPAAKREIQKQIDEMLKNNIIEHSTFIQICFS
jgi:hypothetical protein